MAEGPLSLVFSGLALVASGFTTWWTLVRRGTVHMTQPTVIFFGWDTSTSRHPALQKVFLRTLLYSTGKRGHIIQSMYVTLRRGERRQNFNIWVYGGQTLVRGSGILVADSGVVCNHHFLLPSDGTSFEFLTGEFALDVYAAIVGFSKPLHLHSVNLTVSAEAAELLRDEECGLYFDWGPDSQRYHPHVERHPSINAGEYAGGKV